MELKPHSEQLFGQLRALIKRSLAEPRRGAEDGQLDRAIDELAIAYQTTTDRLENSEIRIRTLVDAIPLGLLIVSSAGRIEAANPASLLLFRCTYEHLIGKQLRDLFELDGRPLDLASYSVSELSKQATEVIALTASQEQFPASVTLRPFASSAETKMMVVVEDTTARHEIERLRQEFISMVSHDLRTPLTSIQSLLSLIAEGKYDGDLDLMKERVRGIESDASRLIGMINSLLEIHKMESGRLDLFIEVIPCAQIIKRSLQSISPLAERQKIKLVVDAIDPEIHVQADSDYSVQVLVNLLSNAIKFSPDGESIQLTNEVRESDVKLIVRDHGPGISLEFQKRLFNRFEQARLSDSRIKGGTGLGLAIAKGIVEQQGGTIAVESEEGQGSTFWFTLPRVII